MNEKKPQPAIILIPDLPDSINADAYLQACTDVVIKEVYIPISPMNYWNYHMSVDYTYLSMCRPILSAVFLFDDYGSSTLMDKAVSEMQGIVQVRKFTLEELQVFSSTLETYLKEAADKQNVTVEAMKGRTRKREVVMARQFYCYRARKYTGHSLEKIGNLIGKDHATVLHSIGVVENTTWDDYQRLYYGRVKKTAKPTAPVPQPQPEFKPEVRVEIQPKKKDTDILVEEITIGFRPYSYKKAV